jgi:two-component sensor histidine kinase
VATVHDQLWRQADASEVDLASYLSSLAAAVATAAPRHATVVEVEPAMVSAGLAVPLGLLVNELVANAYKYAYAPGEEGEVRVAGKRTTKEHYRLEVSDLGRGLPSEFNLGRSRTSLGMRVVTSMAAQLNGTLTVSPAEPGIRFTLEFPLRGLSERTA